MPTLNHWDKLWQTGIKFDVHPELIGLVRRFAPGKRVLEVGYGTGGDLLALQQLGFDTHGLESSVVAHKRGKVLFGKNATLGEGEHMPYEDIFFDAIFHQGLLEHFPNPRSFLLEQRRVLKQDGAIIIDVPHLWNLYTLYRNFRQLKGDWYGGWERSYSAGQLRKVLSETGFEPIEIQYRGIWPHQWGKWLFPERIEQKAWVQRLLKNSVMNQLQRASRWFYDSFAILRVLSSYNVCIVARRRPLQIALDARYAESAGGGIKTYLEVIARAIAMKGDTPVLLSTKPLSLILPEARTLVVPQKKHWWIWEQFQLPLALRQVHADLYHAVANGGVPLLSRTPSLVTVQDLIPLQDQQFFSRSKVPFAALLSYLLRIKIAANKSEKILCTNNDTAQMLTKYFGIDTSKLSTIPLGVTNTFYTPVSRVARHQITLPKPYILYHGGIAERKNIETLLRGFAQFKKRDTQSFQLYITGENPELLLRIKALAETLNITNQINWIGWVSSEKLTKLVSDANFIVYPSKYEGFGLPVLEGMLAGKPVVVSDLPLFRRLAKNIPVYFDPQEPEDLARALQVASENVSFKRLLLGQLIAKRYSWQKTVDATYEQYLQILARTKL